MKQGKTVGQTTFLRGLSVFDSANIVMGAMIGSGIFIVSADIARQVGGTLLCLVVWLVSAVMTVLGASCYGELAAMFPRAGGQYVFLREAYGKSFAFLYGWTLVAVIQTGTIAAVAVAFAKFLGVLVPWVSSAHTLARLGPFAISSEQLVAVLALVALTGNNALGLRAGKLVQNVFTVTKVGILLAVTSVGLVLGSGAGFSRESLWLASRQGATMSAWDVPVAVAVALVGALFSSDAWNNITFAAAEVKRPERTVPKAMIIGTAVVCLLYLLTNVAYLNVLGPQELGGIADDRVGSAVMRTVFGPMGAKLTAALVMVSTFGCLNGMILAGPRLYYAMARDGLFFSAAGKLGRRSRVPVWGLWIQCGWAVVLTFSGRYGDLLDYVIFAALLFYVLTVVGIFRLRRRRPEAPRPFRAPLYPYLPALYILLCAFVMTVLLVEKPAYTWPGLLIVLAGVPVYLSFHRVSSRRT